MRVSCNELGALLNRVFEGQGLIDFEAASKQVLWFEQCGLRGLERLSNIIQYLRQSDSSGMQVIDEPQGHMSLDLAGNSALVWGATAVDLASSQARQDKATTLQLENCRNRIFILQPLAECALQGMNCLAHWQVAAAQRQQQLAIFPAGERYPLYDTWEPLAPRATQLASSVTLICSESNEPLQDYVNRQRDMAEANLHRLDADHFRANARDSLDNGIEVDDRLWKLLSRMGERVLVESSDTSRSRGAGPAG